MKTIVPPGWHHVDLGEVHIDRLAAMFEFIVNNKLFQVVNGHFPLVSQPMDNKTKMPLSIRWELCLSSVQMARSSIPSQSHHAFIVSEASYRADFAFRNVDDAVLFRMKFA